MTIRQIIELVDQGKENAIETGMKVRWIAELDGKIAADVFLMGYSELQQFSYTEAASMDVEPLVSFPHDDIYRLWLMAKIDLANGEYNKYQNTMIAYNESYGNFVRWFARVWQPAQGESGCYCVNENTPQYYITAYGLAVKLGFVGTVEQWLESLKGEMGDVTPELEQLRQDVIAEKQAAETAAARAEAATPVIRKGTGTDSMVQVVTEPSESDNDPQPVASERGAVALGRFTKATAKEAMAVNYNNKANARNAFAANANNEVNSEQGAAFGYENVTGDDVAIFVAGLGNIASGLAKTVFGKYNKPDSSAAFSVGDGESDENRSNAFSIYGKDSEYGRAIALGDMIMNEAMLGLVKLCTTNPAILAQIERLTKIPEIDKTYLDQNFENGTAGVSLLGGGGEGDVNEIRSDGDNHYLHMQRATSDVKVYASISSGADVDYVLVSVDIAFKAFTNSTHIKVMQENADSFYAISITKTGEVYFAKQPTGKIISADGEFVNFTLTLDAMEGKSALWVNGEKVVTDYRYAIGKMIAVQIEQTGNGGIAMVDNLKICRYIKEWENPPLAAGVEYRTTKRYKGSPVYAKLISFGELGDPNTEFYMAHGVTCMEFTTVDIHAKAGLVTIRFANGGQDGQVQAGVNSTDVFITLAGRGYWGYTAWAYLEYIKN